MNGLRHVAAFVVFLVIYFVAALVGGLVVIQLSEVMGRYHETVGVQGPQWWLINGVPFVISIITGAVGANVASRAARSIFRSIPLIRIALAFVAFLTLQWLGELFFGNLSWFVYATGVAMAVSASVAAIEEGSRVG